MRNVFNELCIRDKVDIVSIECVLRLGKLISVAADSIAFISM